MGLERTQSPGSGPPQRVSPSFGHSSRSSLSYSPEKQESIGVVLLWMTDGLTDLLPTLSMTCPTTRSPVGRSPTLSRSASQNKVGGDYDATRRRSLFITPSASTRNAVRPCSQFEPLALYCWLSECAVSSQGGEARRCPNFEGLKDGSPGQFGIRDARKMGNSRGESLSRSPSKLEASPPPRPQMGSPPADRRSNDAPLLPPRRDGASEGAGPLSRVMERRRDLIPR